MSGLRSGNSFSGLALDRADDHRNDAAWVRARWDGARVLVLNAHADALVDADDALAWVPSSHCAAQHAARAVLLGVDASDQAWFALALQPGEPCPGVVAPRWLGLRRAAAAWPEFDSGLFAYARALALWHERSRYCGRCGVATEPTRAGHGMRCRAQGCGLEHYPRMDPAVIVLVTHGDSCLLGRQAAWPARQYSTLAGFVEPGESLEDALCREVGEESGVTLRDARYHSSQPWPFPSSLMLGFHAEADSTAIRLGDELEDVRWFQVDALLAAVASGEVRPSTPISISWHLLYDWVARLRGAEAAAVLGRSPVPLRDAIAAPAAISR